MRMPSITGTNRGERRPRAPVTGPQTMVVGHYRDGTDDTNWVIPEIVHQDIYRVQRLARSLRHAKGVVLDCGAHIGAFACMLAHHGVTNEIHAFEPEPSNYRLLVANAQRFPTIAPIPEAVGCCPGQLRLYDRGDTGRWSFVPEEAGARGSLVVQVTDLYDHIRRVGDVALLKLDLEGYEADILNGMPSDVLDRIHIMVIEQHHRSIDFARLREAGFWTWYTPGGASRHRVLRRDRPWGDGKSFVLDAPRCETPRVLIVANVEGLGRRMDQSLYHRHMAMARHANVTLTGPGCEGFAVGMPVGELLQRFGPVDFLIHGVDLGVTCVPLVSGLEEVGIPKAMELVDTWQEHRCQEQFLRDYRFGFGFHTPCPWEGGYEETCPDVRFLWTPNAIRTDIFRDYGLEKTNDVLLFGALLEFYPLRRRLARLLRRLGAAGDIRVRMIDHPGYGDRGYVPHARHLVGPSLAAETNRSWITIATASSNQALFTKHLEAAACKSLVAGSMPDQARPFFGRGYEDLAGLSDDEITATLHRLLSDKQALWGRIQEGWWKISAAFSVERYATNLLALVSRLMPAGH